jgi:hypothetical protein
VLIASPWAQTELAQRGADPLPALIGAARLGVWPRYGSAIVCCPDAGPRARLSVDGNRSGVALLVTLIPSLFMVSLLAIQVYAPG